MSSSIRSTTPVGSLPVIKHLFFICICLVSSAYCRSIDDLKTNKSYTIHLGSMDKMSFNENSNIKLICNLEEPDWYLNDENILNTWQGINVDEDILRITQFSRVLEGKYTCRNGHKQHDLILNVNTTNRLVKKRSDNDDEDTKTTNVTVDPREMPQSAPKFDSKMGDMLIPKASGHMVRMKCKASGNPWPNITWTKDYKPIIRNIGIVSYKTWSMEMIDLVPNDSGDYTCHVCNIHGCISYTRTLKVKDRISHAPIFTNNTPANLTVKPGEIAMFNISIISDLHPIINWYKGKCNNKSQCTPDKIINGPELDDYNSLVIENVTYSDEGWYTCVASNSLGSTLSSAYLRVVNETYDGTMPIRKHSVVLNIFAIVMGISFVIALAFLSVTYRKSKRRMEKRAMGMVHQYIKKVTIVGIMADGLEQSMFPIVKIEKQRTMAVRKGNQDDTNFDEYEFPLDSNWEFPRNQLQMGELLGEGCFGQVMKGEAHGLTKAGESSIVAVKMLKEGHSDSDIASLFQEMEVMKMIGKHKNIINLLGCCTQDGPLYVIVEYAHHGNLKDFLKKNDPDVFHDKTDHGTHFNLTQKDLISFSFQIARGMEYLASRRCIHRDLAARNILVSENLVMKIADFGLARDIQETEYYRKYTNGRLPVKWMAPESFRDKKYDSQSDVWSFGILLWEIMMFGQQPYPTFNSLMVIEQLFDYLESGGRLEKPPKCSLNIYMLMRQCWMWDSHARPTFSEIVENLDKILGATCGDEYLDLGSPMLETPPSSDDEEEFNKDYDNSHESDSDTYNEESLLYYQNMNV